MVNVVRYFSLGFSFHQANEPITLVESVLPFAALKEVEEHWLAAYELSVKDWLTPPDDEDFFCSKLHRSTDHPDTLLWPPNARKNRA